MPVVTEARLNPTVGDGPDNRKNFLMDKCQGLGRVDWRDLGPRPGDLGESQKVELEGT